MKKSLLILQILSVLPSWAALNVPLTVQEALYSGGSTGIARTNEPFCMGVPLADSAGIASTSVLSLTGATAGQFRVLGRWPDGKYKWVKVCGIVPVLSAGGTATVTLIDSGSGNFGGPNLATDNGSTITVATGVATFTIKKSGFNVIDSAVVGGTTLVASSGAATRGLILTGPSPTTAFPGNVTCSGASCSTVYSSANDPNSTCSIEENGPVMAVVKCTGNHMDGSGNPYMQYTARESFYQGKGWVKVTSVLRNANYNTSLTPSPDAAGNTFNTAYKGIEAYELRITPNLTGSLNYKIATDTAPQAGVLSGSDSAYIYQGQSQFMVGTGNATCGYQSSCANSYTTDTGFSVVKNGSPLVSGSSTQYPQGWADISDANGNGLEIGVYQMSAYYPKSLEFNGGGTDVRIGIFPRQNSQPVYQAWPAWSIHDLFLEFHTSNPVSLANEFLKFQHYLLARASVSYYNSTDVFPYPIVDPAVEDAYYVNAANTSVPSIAINHMCWSGGTTNCTPDRDVGNGQTAGSAMNLGVYRQYVWSAGGPLNQEEFRWSDLQKFLQRGFTGRFLNSAHFYRFQAERVWPHSDGTSSTDSALNNFTWRSRPHWGTTGAELDGVGQPSVACNGDSPCAKLANSPQSFVSYGNYDLLHFHWYGMPDYYFLTGDETVRDAMVPLKDHYINNNTYQGWASGGLSNTRAIGIELMGASRFGEYLQATGDAEYSGVLAQALTSYTNGVKPDVCVSGYPVGCTPPPVNNLGSPPDPIGVSRVRGVHSAARGQGWCPDATGPNFYRSQESFQESILIEGILALRRAEGPGWSDYNVSLDLAYGLSQWSLIEAFNDDGTVSFQGSNALFNGFRYEVPTDFANVCPSGTPVIAGSTFQIGSNVFDGYTTALATQGMWLNFYAQYLMNGTTADWERKFKIAMDQVGYHQSIWPADFGSYQIGTLIDAINRQAAPKLQDVAFTAHDNGGGNYSLTFTPPAGSSSLRIKWSPKILAPSTGLLNFDNLYTNTFGIDPATHATWFGANNVTEPIPTPGQQQTFAISTGVTGLTAPNFSVKAYTTAGGGNPPPGPAAKLIVVSGLGQTGTTGKQLPSPFTVEVTDINGNPISGINVTFAVTAGGGSLTATLVTTNAAGFATTTLTLGPNVGVNTVTATSGTLTGSPITFNATGVTAGPGPAADLVLVSGTAQTGTTGQQLSAPFTVKVTDANGTAISGINVTFTVTSGGGSLTATQVITNTQGLASSTLTLGANAGANAVTAASGTLAGSPITFTATGTAPGQGGSANVTWTRAWTSPKAVTAGVPGWNNWLQLHYDSVSQQTILYGVVSGSNSIYSTDVFSYNSTNNTWTHIGGTGSLSDLCTADAPTRPGDRHPVGQMAVDTKRNVLWLYSGVNQACNVNPAGPNGSPRFDMYYITLNANPLNDVWHQVTPVHIPMANVVSTMVYDPDDDVLFAYGFDGGPGTHANWVYCRTAENPVPGTPTAQQSAAGCAHPDDWSEVSVVGGIQPAGYVEPGLAYDTVTKKVIQFGGSTGSGVLNNQTWAYDIPTKKWIRKCLSCTPPPVPVNQTIVQPAMAYNTATHKVILHQATGAGAPADWQYDPVADTWTKLVSSGGGAAVEGDIVYDARDNMLISWSQNTSSGGADLWVGALSTSNITPNRCDLNADSNVNVLDVQLAINQVLGLTACGNADLIGSGVCSIIDVQRIINASFGVTCQTGP